MKKTRPTRIISASPWILQVYSVEGVEMDWRIHPCEHDEFRHAGGSEHWSDDSLVN